MNKFSKIDTDAIIKRVMQLRGLKKEKEVAELVGTKHPNFSNRKNRGTVVPLIIKWAADNGIDLNWLVTGKTPTPAGHPNDEIKNNVIEIEHVDLVRRFRDKRRAKAANLGLLEIEKLNPIAFKATVEHIIGLAEGLKNSMVADPSPHYGIDRRINDDPSKIPSSGDRRTGTESVERGE